MANTYKKSLRDTYRTAKRGQPSPSTTMMMIAEKDEEKRLKKKKRTRNLKNIIDVITIL